MSKYNLEVNWAGRKYKMEYEYSDKPGIKNSHSRANASNKKHNKKRYSTTSKTYQRRKV